MVLIPAVGVVGGLASVGPLLAAALALIGPSWAVIAVTTTALVTRLAATALGYPTTFAAAGGLVLLVLLLLASMGTTVAVPAHATGDR